MTANAATQSRKSLITPTGKIQLLILDRIDIADILFRGICDRLAERSIKCILKVISFIFQKRSGTSAMLWTKTCFIAQALPENTAGITDIGKQSSVHMGQTPVHSL